MVIGSLNNINNPITIIAVKITFFIATLLNVNSFSLVNYESSSGKKSGQSSSVSISLSPILQLHSQLLPSSSDM